MRRTSWLPPRPVGESYANPDGSEGDEQHHARSPSLSRNFGWTFAGNVIYAASQWGLLVVLAKLGDARMVGEFALALAVTAPIVMFTNLNLRAVAATDAGHEYRFGDYLGLRLTATALALSTIIGIALVGGYGAETALIIVIVGIGKSFDAVSDIYFGLCQQHERMDPIAKSLALNGVLSLAALAVAIAITGSMVSGAIGWAVASLLALGYSMRAAAIVHGSNEVLRPRWAPRTLGTLAVLAAPLGVVMLLLSLNANVPRYVIAHYLGERELGIFAAMAYLMVAGGTVISALGQSASPRLAKHFARGDIHSFRTLLVKFVLIGAGCGSVAVAFALVAGRQILSVLYAPEYAEHIDAFVWLAVAGGIGFVSSFLGYGMTASRRFRIQMPLFGAVTLVTTAASMLLIPAHGLVGAAWALVVAGVVQLALSVTVIWRLTRETAVPTG